MSISQATQHGDFDVHCAIEINIPTDSIEIVALT